MSPSSEPLVSFIIPSYNHANFIGECLESILNQTATQDWEIVLVDDASPDETDRVVQAFRDPRIRYTRHPQNRGLIATLNTAVALARGRYIARQDSDNRYRPDFLEQTLPLLEYYPDVGIVYGDLAEMDAQGTITSELWRESRTRAVHRGQPFHGNEFEAVWFEGFIPLDALIARREVWRDAYPLPGWLPRSFPFDDWYAILHMTLAHDSYYIPRALTDYRLHADNLHNKFKEDPAQERAVLRMLNALFVQLPQTPHWRKNKRILYSRMRCWFGDRYFGAGNYAAARRCYLQYVLYQLPRFPDHGSAHRLVGTFLGPARYERIKTRLKPRADLRNR